MIHESEWWKFLKYSFVGLTNTLVDFGLFCLLVYSLHINTAVTQTISYFAGMAVSFYLNRLWTFQVRKKMCPIELFRFVVINVLAFGTSTTALLMFEHAGMESAFAKILSFAFSFLINYFGYRLWVFQAINHEKSTN